MSSSDLASVSRDGLRVLDTTGSTNDEARAWIEQGASDGSTVVADVQTCGRGRAGRSWHAPAGVNLSLSQIFIAPPEHLRLVPIVGALAARAAIAAHLPCMYRVGIKWPNDILILNLKIAGILGELVPEPTMAAVLGIGVNVNTRSEQFPGDLRRPAASLRMLTGRKVARVDLLDTLLGQLDFYRELWRTSPRLLVAEFAGHCLTLGKRVLVHPPGGEAFEATAHGIAPDGILLCRDDHQNEIAVTAGDVDPLV